jgi:hypothetical protein
MQELVTLDSDEDEEMDEDNLLEPMANVQVTEGWMDVHTGEDEEHVDDYDI